MIDLGTGDGRFVLGQATQQSETFVIGVDASAQAMSHASRRAERGHIANALFLLASIEDLPESLDAIADRVTVNYPWGSLLKAVALPDTGSLAKIRRLLKKDGTLDVLINMQPFADCALAARLGLAEALLVRDTNRFCEAYTRLGLRIDDMQPAKALEARVTSWGKAIHAGRREIWRIRVRCMGQAFMPPS